MAFTAGELTNIASAALDFFMQDGDMGWEQVKQAKPLIKALESKAQSFPGGAANISIGLVGAYGTGANDGLAGFTHNDTVNFYTPANIKRAAYPWREHHIGLTLTHTELKIDGLSLVDTSSGLDVSNHSKRDKTVLISLLKNKLADFAERYAISLNTLYWGDGTADAKALAGLRSIISATPNTGTVGGIDRSVAANAFWRNRARTAANGATAITSSPANGGVLWQELQKERRQLMRYGANPDTFLAGSDFISALETEARANGYYSQQGFNKTIDGAIGNLVFDGIPVVYDPTLDTLGFNKRAYLWDSKDIFLMKMDGEWQRQHDPARPYNQFVVYRSITSTGQIVAKRCNGALVVDIT